MCKCATVNTTSQTTDITIIGHSKRSSNKALPGKPHSSAGHRLDTWGYGRTTGLKMLLRSTLRTAHEAADTIPQAP